MVLVLPSILLINNWLRVLYLERICLGAFLYMGYNQ